MSKVSVPKSVNFRDGSADSCLLGVNWGLVHMPLNSGPVPNGTDLAEAGFCFAPGVGSGSRELRRLVTVFDHSGSVDSRHLCAVGSVLVGPQQSMSNLRPPCYEMVAMLKLHVH